MARTLIINTGGTIDAEKYGDPRPKFSIQSNPSNVEVLLKQLGGDFDYKSWEKMEDSKKFTESDYEKLAKFIDSNTSSKIIILHGTDRMTDLGRFLKTKLKAEKTVLITGAMLPLANGKKSDGRDNIEHALRYEVDKGVYIVFASEIYDPEKIRKNSQKQVFQVVD